MINPIDDIKWIASEDLVANDYNPNVVYNNELDLLELSILKNGWLQPILVTQDNVIIDGFHRWSLSRHSNALIQRDKGKVPCAVLNLTEPERMCLTIRINRAKGSHIAIKMADIIHALINEHGYSIEEVAKQIGANKDEVELLLQNDIFKRKDTQNHKYSKAWYPVK